MIMKALKVFSFIVRFKIYFSNFWYALVAPEAVKTSKKAEAIKTIILTIKEIRDEEREEILFQKYMYKELGVPKKEYKTRMKNMIESRSTPMILNDLKLLINNNESYRQK
jgi:hypothetical protein